ncbi:Uncharacterized membrane protein YesL [Pelagirhabdus alkalitolerans]|uniref:Uncharacterized membrane protein YesL n=1 Tax=Pelagirhabdus alkalitolerans TaxID=1612202 RepID=A0A1G6L5G8_9BACI|nr:YesL family protein [Pelagirhabdus alkalitolerans]SDC37886.1 Uncharacterized membrane protein YesL [Pelagirhabdus alkalitolerans]
MANALFKVAEWISRIAYLNLLWVLFSFLGLVIFGFFPATVTMFVISRRWFRGETDLPVFKTFAKTFKQEFIKANSYGVMIVLIGLVGYAQLLFIDVNPDAQTLVFQISFYLFVLFTSLTLIYLFPVYVHYDLSFFNVFKQAFLIMLIHPLTTIGILISIGLTFWVMYYLPGLLFFFGGSFTVLLIMGMTYSTFLTIDEKAREQS